MRVPLSWLREYCDPGISPAALAERLSLTGTEVERVDSVGVGAAEAFVVGRVLSAGRHPDADRLSVCAVDDGSGNERTIVCGAPNVAAGQTVAVALPGAVMPDGTTLAEVELRGVRSSGMILAEDEVGIGEDHGAIMVLPSELEPGRPLIEALAISDDVLELEITPNRPDCLAVYGIAREVHAVTAAPLGPEPTAIDATPAGADRVEDRAAVEVDPDVCLRFTARAFEDVTIGPSPLWLKARLSAAGQRSISNVVDITNYVMLLTGQPLHAFDLDRVRGGRVVVRRAHEGERMTTLDGVERTFTPDVALVCDAEGPTSVAGIMGGEVSEVSDTTTRVLMEAATWVGSNILATSVALGLRSEASTRFEKQLHPESAGAAQRLAARLMVELCGARLVPGTIDVYPEPLEPRKLSLRSQRAERLLGERIETNESAAILERLGFGASVRADGDLDVVVPHFRSADVTREADLIEEVARIHGLDKLPTTLPARRHAVGRLEPAMRLRRRLEDALRDRGMLEVVAWSFTSPALLDRLRLDPGEPVLRLANPLSEDQSVMRPLLLPGLLDAAAHNAARGRASVALFESAHVYRSSGALEAPEGGLGGGRPAHERHHVGGVLTGAVAGSWHTPQRPVDLYAAKAILEGALAGLGVYWRAVPSTLSFLHPGSAARIELAAEDRSRELGWIGELHPLVARQWDLERVVAFELDADVLSELSEVDPGSRRYRDVTSFPAVQQDIAVVVPEEVTAAQVEAHVRSAGGPLLRSLRLFDVYRGDQVGDGRKSLALSLEFCASDRTLTDVEVAALRSAIEDELRSVDGRLRA